MPWGKYPPRKVAWRRFGGITLQADYALNGPKLGPLETWEKEIVSQVGLNF